MLRIMSLLGVLWGSAVFAQGREGAPQKPRFRLVGIITGDAPHAGVTGAAVLKVVQNGATEAVHTGQRLASDERVTVVAIEEKSVLLDAAGTLLVLTFEAFPDEPQSFGSGPDLALTPPRVFDDVVVFDPTAKN